MKEAYVGDLPTPPLWQVGKPDATRVAVYKGS